MNRLIAANKAPRCSATSKRSQQPCQAPAVRGWPVCRCHGAHGGAPKGKGKANGNWKNGRWTNDANAERRHFAELIAETRDMLGRLP